MRAGRCQEGDLPLYIGVPNPAGDTVAPERPCEPRQSPINVLLVVVDAMRALLVTGDLSSVPMDMVALAVATAALVFLASIGFRRILQ